MIDWARDAMRAWAADRGLRFTEEGLLPPATDALRDGLGVGTRRAGVIRKQTEHTTSTRGGFTKRPERSTWNLCSGVLPGGVEGAVAHHVHLAQMRIGEGHSWYAVPRTVVYVELPERARPVRRLTGGREGGVTALGSVTVARGDEIVRVPRTRVIHDGIAWTATPAEEPARVERLTAAASAALAAAPERTRVAARRGRPRRVARPAGERPRRAGRLPGRRRAAGPRPRVAVEDPRDRPRGRAHRDRSVDCARPRRHRALRERAVRAPARAGGLAAVPRSRRPPRGLAGRWGDPPRRGDVARAALGA